MLTANYIMVMIILCADKLICKLCNVNVNLIVFYLQATFITIKLL